MTSKISRYTRDDVNVVSTSVKSMRSDAWLIEITGRHYVISAIDNEFGVETMAFSADEHGNVTNWTDLAVVFSQDHEDCIAKLIESLNGETR